MALPKRVTDHDAGRAGPLQFFGAEQPAQHRRHAEHLEKFRRHKGDGCKLGFGLHDHRWQLTSVTGHGFERSALVVQVVEIRRRDQASALSAGLRNHPQRDDAVRVAIGERLQKHRVDDAEHGRIGADTERHHDHGKQRKSRVIAQ